MRVRLAAENEIVFIVDLSARVQARLTESGSLQQIGPVPHSVVTGYVGRREAFVLADGAALIGSVFITALTPDAATFSADCALDGHPAPSWFLSKLMIEPERQGHGAGAILLAEAVRQFSEGRGGTLFLDCWAGNDKLRAFYTRNGFRLHGLCTEEDFEVAVFFREL